MTATLNTLVISDLHLGVDLSGTANANTRKHVDLVERHLVEFFRHYSRRRENGLPWRVVINGDFADFMAISIRPDDPHWPSTGGESEEDQVFGLSRTVASGVAKMRMVVERHREVFRAMAKFVARGNRIEVLVGNHDAEFHWAEVQQAFLEGVASQWGQMSESERSGAPSAVQLCTRIGFSRWFFYEPGVCWIEHGHQYDECCSFDYGLNPLHPGRDEIVTNVDTAATRYVTSYVDEADPHQEDWTAAGYVRFAMSLGIRGSLKTGRGYFRFATSLLDVRKATLGPRNRRIRRKCHEQRLIGIAEETGVPIETLKELDALHRRPIVTSMRRLARVLMLDKVLLHIAAAVLSVFALVAVTVPWSVLIAASTFGTARLLSWIAHRGRTVDPGTPLRVIPDRIVSRVDAKYVVFGHTHTPVVQRLSNGSTYFNTGTWVPAGRPGLHRAFTHLVIRHQPTGTHAEICQWRDGASRAFTVQESHSPSGVHELAPAGADAAARQLAS